MAMIESQNSTNFTWTIMEVVYNHVTNTAFKLFKSLKTQVMVLESRQFQILTLYFLTRCEIKQLKTIFIENVRGFTTKMADSGLCSGWFSERSQAIEIQVQIQILWFLMLQPLWLRTITLGFLTRYVWGHWLLQEAGIYGMDR